MSDPPLPSREPPPHPPAQGAGPEEAKAAATGFWAKLGDGIARTAQSLGGLFSKPLPEALRSLSERRVARTDEPPARRHAYSNPRVRQVTIASFLQGVRPAGLVVDDDHHLGGEMVISRTSMNCRVWSSGIQPALESAAQALLAEPARCSLSTGGEIELARNADLELPRLRIRMGGGFITSRQPLERIVAALRAVAESDPAVKVLSAVTRSALLGPLTMLETAEGEPLTIAPPQPCLDGGFTPIINYRFIDHEGVTHDLGRKPGRHSAASFAVERESSSGDFLVSLDWPLYVSGFRRIGEVNVAPLGGNDYLMKLHYRSRWRLHATAAHAGRLQLTLDQPVTVRFEGLLRETPVG